MLNRTIPPNATVLEVGWGTGQLGKFLSTANRRVLAIAQMKVFRLPLQPEVFHVVISAGLLHDAEVG